MPKRIGKYTLEIENDVRILNNAAIVGHKEAEGPLAKYFDKTYSDDKFGESSWEKAESFLQKSAVELALKKAITAKTKKNRTLCLEKRSDLKIKKGRKFYE